MKSSATLIDRTFDEGVALTLEVRNYIAFHEQADRRDYDLTRCLQAGYQHTRISARLIQVMTWLLAMKALLSGEISPEQFASPQYAFNLTDESLDDIEGDAENMPQGLRGLLDRSQSLFARIQRLDAMVRSKLAAGEVPNFGMLGGGLGVVGGTDTQQ